MFSTKPRPYFSARTGANPTAAQLSFESFRSLFHSGYIQFSEKGYFDQSFGFWCVDEHDVAGTAGSDVPNYVLFHTRKHLWPVEAHIDGYEEDDLFDLIEFLHDHVSKPLTGHMHSYSDCGMHWKTFDQAAGKREFREAMNPLLQSYSKGYELNERGEIMELAPKGLSKLLNATLPTNDNDVQGRVNSAIDRFQRYGSSVEDRRHAVRDLADVLEKLRPQAKEVITKKDEADLFQLANSFGIRHLNENQKTDYDPVVWLSWVFYYYLTTINACLHLLERKASKRRV